MIIAVNTRNLADLSFDCFSILAEKYPEHGFIYIFDKAYDPKFITSKNIFPVVAGPEASSVLRMQYWYNYKVPAVLKKYKAAVYVSLDGICSLRTKVPQCLFLHDLSFIHYPQFYPKTLVRFYKKFTPKFLAKARTIATVSESSKKDIIENYAIDPGKISLVYRSAASIFQPIDEKEKEDIKEKYTEGKEYFLFTGSIGPGKNLLNILKAFSFFKKRQKSSMQLVIAGSPVRGYHQFTEDLNTFKFRKEVKLLGDLSKNELAKLTAAAYAMVCPVFVEGLTAHALGAMQCGVPVIVSNGQWGMGNGQLTMAVLYADPGDFMDIADKMMTLFKDERKRNALIVAGRTAVQAFNPQQTANMLWDCINFAAANQ